MADLPKRYTSQEMMTLLENTFQAPEYAVFEQVANSTGFSGTRYADAMVMGLWPSRGLTLIGIEIKVDRSDWLSELKNPKKADDMAKFCDGWAVVAPAGCVQEGELPDTWGLYVPARVALSCKKAPPKLVAEPMTREFLAALLRRGQEANKHLAERMCASTIQNAKKEIAITVREQVDRNNREYLDLRRNLDLIKKRTGIDLLSGHWRTDEIVAVIRFAVGSSIFNSYHGIQQLTESMKDIVVQMERIVQNIEYKENLDDSSS